MFMSGESQAFTKYRVSYDVSLRRYNSWFNRFDKQHRSDQLSRSMVVSTRSVQSLLLPLARKSLGLPLELGHESGADAATQESVASSLQVANVAIRAPIDSDLASNPFVLPME